MTCASWRNFNWVRVVALGLVLLGFAIRLHHLGGDSFWVDEMATVEVSRTLTGAFQGERDHPPFIYVITNLALQAWTESEFSARLPALWAGTLALPAIIIFGRRLHRPGTGLWAGFLLALAPFHLKYAQEARHYAWLLLFTLLAFLFLYQAMARPGWKNWLLFALFTTLNLYTHYGALLVLGAQLLIITGWVVNMLRQGQWNQMKYPLLTGMIIFLSFLPQIPRFWASLPFNVGVDTITDTGRAATLGEWIQNLIQAFGGGSSLLAILFPILALAGLLGLAWKRNWLSFSFLLGGLVAPLIMVPLTGIARGPFPRYLIFLLPLYLVAVSVSLVMVYQLVQKRSRPVAVAISSLLALGFLVISLPRLQTEYQFMVGDWRGVAHQLARQADRPVLAFSLNFPNGYNIAAASLPYYLAEDQPLLVGDGGLSPTLTTRLSPFEPVALVVHDWNPGNPFQDIDLQVSEYQTGLFVLESAGPGLDHTIDLLNHLIPQADAPVPQCLLRQDLAAFQIASGDLENATDTFLEALNQCPSLPAAAAPEVRQAVRHELIAGLTESLVQTGSPDLAFSLLALDPHHPLALETLTYLDLQSLTGPNAWSVINQSANEPVRMESILMPGGEPVPVLLAHPPAVLQQRVQLPTEPVMLYFRNALAPQSWAWGGDGARFQVQVKLDGQEPHLVYDQVITNDPVDQTWHTGYISLAEFAGQIVDIILIAGPGLANDFSGDWAGWEGMRLLRIAEYP